MPVRCREDAKETAQAHSLGDYLNGQLENGHLNSYLW
jgi:hypothetical protein